MLNQFNFMGNLTANPEPARTDSGVEYCRFTVAVDRPKDRDGKPIGTDYFNCSAWNKLSDLICKYFHKGDLIMCVGRVRINSSFEGDDKRSFTNIIVKEIHFTGGRRKELNDNADELDFSYNPEDFEEIPIEDLPF